MQITCSDQLTNNNLETTVLGRSVQRWLLMEFAAEFISLMLSYSAKLELSCKKEMYSPSISIPCN